MLRQVLTKVKKNILAQVSKNIYGQKFLKKTWDKLS